MRDHLDVDVALGQRGEHPPCDPDHVAHLLPDQAEDGQLADDVDGAVAPQLLDGLAEVVLVHPAVQRHRHVHLARADQVDRQAPFVQRREDVGEEAVRERLAVAVDVDDDDRVLDGHGCGPLAALHQVRVLRTEPDVARWLRRRVFALARDRVREDHGALAGGVLDVLDADGDPRPDHLLHGERVDDLGAVVGQLGGFLGRDHGDEARCGDLAWVGGEDPVDFFPHLELVGVEANGEEGAAEVCIAAADGGEEGARNGAEVAWGYELGGVCGGVVCGGLCV